MKRALIYRLHIAIMVTMMIVFLPNPPSLEIKILRTLTGDNKAMRYKLLEREIAPIPREPSTKNVKMTLAQAISTTRDRPRKKWKFISSSSKISKPSLRKQSQNYKKCSTIRPNMFQKLTQSISISKQP